MTSASVRRARKRQRKEMKAAKESPTAAPQMNPLVLGAPAETAESLGSLTSIVQINRLPEGFFEDQLRDFFHQFGNVSAARVWRNKRTGGSKGVAWVHFDNVKVAQIASETLHNYLCFGKIMKCRVLYKKQVPQGLFDKRFERPVEKNWTAIQHVKLVNAIKTDKTMRNNIKRASKRERRHGAKLEALGVHLVDEKKPLGQQLPLESFRSTQSPFDESGDQFSMIIDSDDTDMSFNSLPHTVRRRKSDKTPVRHVQQVDQVSRSSSRKSLKHSPKDKQTPKLKLAEKAGKRRLSLK